MESDDGEAEIRSISLLIAGESKGEPRRILGERPLGRATSGIPWCFSSGAERGAMESDDGEAEIRSISLLIAGESKGEPRRILGERPLGRATSGIPRGLSSGARRAGWNQSAEAIPP